MRKFLLVMLLTVFPVLAHGATYYVAKTGSDSNSCANAQSQSTPKLTINAGASCLKAGDTLIIKAGTYAELLNNVFPSGTVSTPTTIKSEVQYGAVIQPVWSASLIGAIKFVGVQYIVLDGFLIDGTNFVGNALIELAGGANNITIQNNEIRNMPYNDTSSGGAGIESDDNTPTNNIIRNNKIHDIGIAGRPDPSSGLIHGIYLHSGNNLVEGNDIYHNEAYGIQLYNAYAGQFANGNVLRNNRVYDNVRFGILLDAGDSSVAYNNIVYNNGRHGIQIGGYSNVQTNLQAYNNTMYNNASNCIQVGSQYTGPSNTIIRNNICYQNGGDFIGHSNDSNSIIDHNLFGVNPLFVNASAADFRLQAGSPAIGVGVVMPGVTYTGSAPDLGAVQSGTGGQPNVPAPTALRLVGN